MNMKLDFDLIRNLTDEGRLDERDAIINEFAKDAKAELGAFKVECKSEELLQEVTGGCKFFNFRCWTDVTPGIISKVINSKTIEVIELGHMGDWRLIHHPEDCLIGLQEWIIYLDENDISRKIFTLRKNGRWVEKGSTIKNGYRGVITDAPRYYYDWSF